MDDQLKIKIPSKTWILYDIGSKIIKKPRMYAKKSSALSAISSIHTQWGNPAIKIYREVDKDAYFVMAYSGFWGDEITIHGYAVFKNPTDIEEITVPKYPKLKYRVTRARMMNCMKCKDGEVSLGAPIHESEGDPLFLVKVSFKFDIKGWETPATTVPLLWYKNELSVGHDSLDSGSMIVSMGHQGDYLKTGIWNSVLTLDAHRDDKLHVAMPTPDKFMKTTDADKKKIVSGIALSI